MSKNLKNIILGDHSFSNIFSIVESTIQMCMGRVYKNLWGKSLSKSHVSKSLVRTNSNFKTIIFGLFFELACTAM